MPTNPNTAEPTKPRRRWFQFRLRTLLVVVVLLGAACGYVAHEWRIVASRTAGSLATEEPLKRIQALTASQRMRIKLRRLFAGASAISGIG